MPDAQLPDPGTDVLDERVAAYQRDYVARRERLLSARATVRSEIEGAAGAAFSRQQLLLQRPRALRLDVLGLMGQRALVLATDGSRYEIFRAGQAGIERGDLHPAVLWETAGLPLTPEAAVGVLLGVPELPADDETPPSVEWDGASGEAILGYAEATFRFDAAGRLRGYRWHPDGHDWVVARYDDWRAAGADLFPHAIAMEFPSSGGRVSVAVQSIELNPSLSPDLFRLSPPGPLSSAAEGGAQ